MIVRAWKVAPLIALALVMAGCATRVRLVAPRTPTMNTIGIQRVAVMPFQPHSTGSEHTALANTLTGQVSSSLRAANAFILIDAAMIHAARSRGASIETYVDALFTGRVTRYHATTTQREERRRDRAGNTTTHVFYQREVELAFEYYFVRARDGTIIGPVSRSGRQSARSDSRNNLTPELTIAGNIISEQLRQLYRDVAPFTINISRTLERERNRALRPHMDAALEHVRAGNYFAARQAYIAIWDMHGSVPAAINASILYEALGETAGAVSFMQHVVVASGGVRRATQTLTRLNVELQHQMGVGAFEAMRTPVERVAEHALSEVRQVLPAVARLWIHNDAATDHGLVNDVIDNMTSAFLRSGVLVVERQQIDLIVAEQNLHLDGSVSDRDFVGIGNLAGANTIVIIGITGVGHARRLQVRALDIATGTLLMQSGTGSEWRL